MGRPINVDDLLTYHRSRMAKATRDLERAKHPGAVHAAENRRDWHWAALGWLALVEVDRMLAPAIERLVAERDESRKLYAEAWAAEHEDASPFGARIVAGRRWGRVVAFELYPDHVLEAWLRSDGGYDDDGEQEIARRMLDERSAFDLEVTA